MEKVLLVRISGEIGTKGKQTRLQLEKHLGKNIKKLLPHDYSLQWELGRFVITGPLVETLVDDIRRVFGVASVSVCTQVSSTVDVMITAASFFIEKLTPEQTFKIDVRRVKTYPTPSPELEKTIALALLQKYSYLQPDLRHPYKTIFIDVRDTYTYVFTDSVLGPSGLPYGSEGHALVLFSGGYDSAVAAWEIAKRGVALEFCFFNLVGETGINDVALVYNTLIDLWHMHNARIHIIDGKALVEQIKERTDDRYKQIVFKVVLYKAVNALARKLCIDTFITGESLGQVSTQTLPHLVLLDRVSECFVLRPLVGRNKQEIIDRSKDIGTYLASSVVKEFCQLTQHKVVTKAKEVDVLEREKKLAIDYDALSYTTITGVYECDAQQYAPDTLQDKEVLHVDHTNASALQNLDKTKQYVFVCQANITAKNLAAFFRKQGYTCYSLTTKEYERMK